MTHASVPEQERVVLGISDTLIRLSVGLEDEQDIIDDLDQALAAAVSVSLWHADRVTPCPFPPVTFYDDEGLIGEVGLRSGPIGTTGNSSYA